MNPGWIDGLVQERKNVEAAIRGIERLMEGAARQRELLPWTVSPSPRVAEPAPVSATGRREAQNNRGFWDSAAGKVVSSVVPFGGWISAIAGLFGGGGREEPAPLVRFAKPSPVRVEAGFVAGENERLAPVVRGQGHKARVASPGPTQVTVQVQAIDSRSFLEHSREIADAVRLAMLSGHELNDAVREL